MSDDGTREILNNLASYIPKLYIIDNPKKTTSCGLNNAINIATGDIIIRMDVHTVYAANYLTLCCATLTQTQATNVGGPWRAIGNGYVQSAIAQAFHSPFAVGGARSHIENYEGPVDSVYLGCWFKCAFDKFGLFDDNLIRNQDDEHNFRIIESGGVVWQNPEIKSWYYPRSNIKDLYYQYLQYGYWKVRVIQKHNKPAALRHLVPSAFILVLIFSTMSALVSTWGKIALVTLLGSYALSSVFASFIACHKARNYRFFPIMPVIFMAFQFGYGIGFIRGIVDFIILKRDGSECFQVLTRS